MPQAPTKVVENYAGNLDQRDHPNRLKKGGKVLWAKGTGIFTNQPVSKYFLANWGENLLFCDCQKNVYMSTPLSRRVGLKVFRGSWSTQGSSLNSSKTKKRRKATQQLSGLIFLMCTPYGSIPHNLIIVAVDHYHIRHRIQSMIIIYLGDIKLQVEQTTSGKTRGPRKSAAGNQGIHGWPCHDTTEPCTGKKNPDRTGSIGFVGKEGWFLSPPPKKKVKVPGIQNGKTTERSKEKWSRSSCEAQPKCLGKW